MSNVIAFSHADEGFVTIDELLKNQENRGEVRLMDLQEDDELLVRTANSEYRMKVMNPKKRDVSIRGGQYFPETTEVTIIGSNWGGSMLSVGTVGVGMYMEICWDAHPFSIQTSAVQSISIKKANNV